MQISKSGFHGSCRFCGQPTELGSVWLQPSGTATYFCVKCVSKGYLKTVDDDCKREVTDQQQRERRAAELAVEG
jgi:hypothetical protein